jgi:DNA repair protein RadC
MENIKSMPPMERPREKLRFNGARSLSDAELVAILLGSGIPEVPLDEICRNLLWNNQLKDIVAMDIGALCKFKGIGPAKATILLAAAEFSRRLQPDGQLLANERACCGFLRPLLAEATQLQYILLLISSGRELLALAEEGSVLPGISWVTELAVKAGAGRILLGRNGWPAFSKLEAKYSLELQAAAAALGMVCEGLMAVGPERFKMS